MNQPAKVVAKGLVFIGARAIATATLLDVWREANARRIPCPRKGCTMTTAPETLEKHNRIHHGGRE